MFLGKHQGPSNRWSRRRRRGPGRLLPPRTPRLPRPTMGASADVVACSVAGSSAALAPMCARRQRTSSQDHDSSVQVPPSLSPSLISSDFLDLVRKFSNFRILQCAPHDLVLISWLQEQLHLLQEVHPFLVWFVLAFFFVHYLVFNLEVWCRFFCWY